MKPSRQIYDPGQTIYNDEWLCLHRNENAAANHFWRAQAQHFASLAESVVRYPDATAAKLRAQLAALHGVASENIFVGSGSDEVLGLLLLRARRSALHLLTWEVGYRVYDMLAARHRFILSRLPAGKLRVALTRRRDNAVLVLDSPNAVTGERHEIEDLISGTGGESGTVIWDNCYGEFAGDIMPASVRSRVVVVRSFSKFYGLAGMRLGYCVAPAGLVQELLREKDVFNVGALAQAMGSLALENQSYFLGLAKECLAIRTRMVDTLKLLGFTVPPPAGNFVFAMHPTLSATCIKKRLEALKILVRHFDGEHFEHGVRITVPTPMDFPRLEESLHQTVYTRRLKHKTHIDS